MIIIKYPFVVYVYIQGVNVKWNASNQARNICILVGGCKVDYMKAEQTLDQQITHPVFFLLFSICRSS